MNKMPKKKSHTVRRLLSYVGRGYLIRFFLVLVCILVSAVASVASSLFLKDLIDVYIMPLLAMDNPVFTGLSTPCLRWPASMWWAPCAPWPTTA